MRKEVSGDSLSLLLKDAYRTRLRERKRIGLIQILSSATQLEQQCLLKSTAPSWNQPIHCRESPGQPVRGRGLLLSLSSEE